MLHSKKGNLDQTFYLSADFSSLLLLEAMEFMEEAVLTELVDEPAVKQTNKNITRYTRKIGKQKPLQTKTSASQLKRTYRFKTFVL